MNPHAQRLKESQKQKYNQYLFYQSQAILHLMKSLPTSEQSEGSRKRLCKAIEHMEKFIQGQDNIWK